jgi:hypothetical protein
LGRCADPAQQFFNYLTLKFDAESSSLFHGKILSPIVWDARPRRLL